MPETRVKVYRTPEEQRQDEADASANGWRVEGRDAQGDGTLRVTFSKGAEWGEKVTRPWGAGYIVEEPRRSRRIRLSSIAIVAWCLLMLAWAVSAVNANVDCAGAYPEACEAGATIGRGIGILFIGFVWFVGFLVLSLVWFATRPGDR